MELELFRQFNANPFRLQQFTELGLLFDIWACRITK
jgi:hypothetical protein